MTIFYNVKNKIKGSQPRPSLQPGMGEPYNPPPYPLPNPPAVGQPTAWVQGGTNSCWRDAKKEYNNSTKWPMTIGYWGACVQGGCGGGGNKDVARKFDDIDPLWDVVILSFLEFCADPITPPNKCESNPAKATGNMWLNLTRSSEELVGINEAIITRQTHTPKKFVLASLGGANGSKIGPDDDKDAWVKSIFESWVIVANYYHLDGIDIDIEAPFDKDSYMKFLKKVADGGWIVSCAPILSNQQIGSTYNATTCVCKETTNNRTWCDVSKYPLETDRPYNAFIQPDMIGFVDIINLQIYNNVMPASSGLFEKVMYEWLATFAIWCQDNCSVLDCPAAIQKDCAALPKSFDMIDPTKTITCKDTNPNPRLTPHIIKQKFYMGFCGQDCSTFHFDSKLINKLLPYFRGIMIWAIDESLNITPNSPTATNYIKTLLALSPSPSGDFIKCNSSENVTEHTCSNEQVKQSSSSSSSSSSKIILLIFILLAYTGITYLLYQHYYNTLRMKNEKRFIILTILNTFLTGVLIYILFISCST